MIPSNYNERARADQLLRWMPAGSIIGAEVGVFRGDVSRLLLAAREELLLYMVDAWAPFDADGTYAQTDDPHATTTAEEQELIFSAAQANVADFGRRAVLIRAMSTEAAKGLKDHSLDFVFIDGDHSYEGVMADLMAWVPKVKPGGVVMGHDYDNPAYPKLGVKRAVDEFFATEPETGADMTWRIIKQGAK